MPSNACATRTQDQLRNAPVGVSGGQRRGQLVVVGTGIQWAGQTTLAAQRAIAAADRVLFAVRDPWAARWIQKLNARSESFEYPRDGRPRRAIYKRMVERVLEALNCDERVCAAFYGSPAVLTWPAHESIRVARHFGYLANMLPGVSSLDCLFADLGVDPGQEGCQLFEAGELLRRRVRADPASHLVLFQIALVGNEGRPFNPSDEQRIRAGLEALIAHLRAWLPRDHRVLVYEAASNPLATHRAESIPLDMLARVPVSETSTLYVPPAQPVSY